MAESISFEKGELPSDLSTSLHVSPRARERRDLTAECGLGDSRCCVRFAEGVTPAILNNLAAFLQL